MRKVGFVCTVHSLKVYDFTRLHYVSRRRCCFLFCRLCHVLDNNCLRMTKIIRKVTQVNSHCTRCGRGLFTATKRLHTKVTPSSACFFSRSFFPRKTKALFCKQASNRKLDTTLRTKRSLAVFFQ